MTEQNEHIRHGLRNSDYKFTRPVAISSVGKFLYVLDKVPDNPTIAMFSYSLDSSGDMVFSYEGTTDFGLDISGASDLTSFPGAGLNILYISDAVNGEITRIFLM